MIRYIADQHFDSEEILAYDNRPFDSVSEMNEAMIANWNSVVRPEDLTWILGDFCAGKSERWREILGRLNGKKALILGNHDDPQTVARIADCFEEIAEYREITGGNCRVILCHYPVFAHRDHYFGSVHLYGHVHQGYEWNVFENAKRLIRNLYVREDILCAVNTGAMLPYMNYTPRSLEELLRSGDRPNRQGGENHDSCD